MGGEVSYYVTGGKDLMFPGISIGAEGLPEFSTGETWAVIVPSNPSPTVVGSACMISSEALKAELRGKAFKISHHYTDTLWHMDQSTNHRCNCETLAFITKVSNQSIAGMYLCLGSKETGCINNGSVDGGAVKDDDAVGQNKKNN